MPNVLVIGSGGREHALAYQFALSQQVNKVFVAPGNPGMPLSHPKIHCVDIPVNEIRSLCQFAQQESVDLSFVGPEAALAAGVVDLFKSEGLQIVGPSRQASQLETSKEFAKKVMEAAGIPTAKYQVFEEDQLDRAISYAEKLDYPIVIKEDGLAAGKGVQIVSDFQTAQEVIPSSLVKGKILLEEFLEGNEFSYFALVNHQQVIPLTSACDYKRDQEEDQGVNTGGMGAFSPVNWVDSKMDTAILEDIVAPLAEEMCRQGIPYTGVLYVGGMVTREGIKVIEFNARFGDPETQVILPRIQTDFYDLCLAHLHQEPIEVEFDARISLGVVIASQNYPYESAKGLDVSDFKSSDLIQVYYAGVSQEGERLLSDGGRILLVQSMAENSELLRQRIYDYIDQRSNPQLKYRKDIGLNRERREY
ncbi:MAG: phosphoribosylamine--glycine ligase [Facklamia hominis]|uniref:phosphoribosylamine--glycine ligase n=1 Tax=Facklamia hominis TaxID=178214 RepID=UPI0028893CAD|nr:phosphoribosylamine--glycine ligase [Facklamia hominis]